MLLSKIFISDFFYLFYEKMDFEDKEIKIGNFYYLAFTDPITKEIYDKNNNTLTNILNLSMPNNSIYKALRKQEVIYYDEYNNHSESIITEFINIETNEKIEIFGKCILFNNDKKFTKVKYIDTLLSDNRYVMVFHNINLFVHSEVKILPLSQTVNGCLRRSF